MTSWLDALNDAWDELARKRRAVQRPAPKREDRELSRVETTWSTRPR